jgi:hypothetical protein
VIRLGGAAVRDARAANDRARTWSIAAFALALVGLALSVSFILGSQTDTSDVRWWLVVAPTVVTAVPLLFPRLEVRVAAMAVLGTWCIVASFSIGLLLVPALAAAVAAAASESR